MPMVQKDSGYHIHHALFCVPCILFSDAVLRGQHLRLNQGIAFTLVGFRSWKKQHSSVLQHEACTSHRNSIVAQATFLQQRTIEHSLNQLAEVELTRRKAEVMSNRTILKRIVDAIMFLGHQGPRPACERAYCSLDSRPNAPINGRSCRWFYLRRLRYA